MKIYFTLDLLSVTSLPIVPRRAVAYNTVLNRLLRMPVECLVPSAPSSIIDPIFPTKSNLLSPSRIFYLPLHVRLEAVPLPVSQKCSQGHMYQSTAFESGHVSRYYYLEESKLNSSWKNIFCQIQHCTESDISMFRRPRRQYFSQRTSVAVQ